MKDQRKHLLSVIADLNGTPSGAYNIRLNGESIGRASTPGVTIQGRSDGSGLRIDIAPGVKGETVYIPVMIDQSGLVDQVVNEFYIGEGCDIEIIAGCGIHNDGHALSQHDGNHIFHVGKGANVRYVEKHYGHGGGDGGRVLNPTTQVYLDAGSQLEMETVQIEGVDDTRRETSGTVGADATLIVKEKLKTSGKQTAATHFAIDLDGPGASTNLISRSVAKDRSQQAFFSQINGNNACMGHSECDAIIMDAGTVKAVPEIVANHVDASLIHEAAIGKIAGEQIVKLLTLGLTQEEAEAQIVSGFLK